MTMIPAPIIQEPVRKNVFIAKDNWPVSLQEGLPIGANCYTVLEDVQCLLELDTGDRLAFTIQKGFMSDGASGPGIDKIDKYGWLLHDWLYTTHGEVLREKEEYPVSWGHVETRSVSKEEADQALIVWRKYAVHPALKAWATSYMSYERLIQTDFGKKYPERLVADGSTSHGWWAKYIWNNVCTII